MLRVVVSNHILSHLGEVSTLRGMKGLAGAADLGCGLGFPLPRRGRIPTGSGPRN